MNSELGAKLHYHHWANMKLLNHLKNLGEGVFFQEVKSVFPSISMTFTHIFQVDQMWLKRLLGKSERSFEKIQFENPSDAIKNFEQLFQQYKILSLEERTIFYQNTQGESFQNQIQDIIQHIMNHGTYHRGNVSAMLHQLGEKSVSTDYIYYLRNRND